MRAATPLEIVAAPKLSASDADHRSKRMARRWSDPPHTVTIPGFCFSEIEVRAGSFASTGPWKGKPASYLALFGLKRSN